MGECARQEEFKSCPLCGERWGTLEEFVHDEDLRLDGYTAFFDNPERGLVFVTHVVPHCGTTLTLPAARLKSLHRGPVYTELRKGLDDCRRLCLDRHMLADCDAPCEMAWVRGVLQHLQRHEMPDEPPAQAASS